MAKAAPPPESNHRPLSHMKCFAVFLLSLATIFTFSALKAEEPAKPNIVFVFCDDLGYGDIHCLNPERGKIPTPAVDRLAREGMIFTEAFSKNKATTPASSESGISTFNTKTQKAGKF